MPTGFKGAPARLYLERANRALTDASRAHNQSPSSATRGASAAASVQIAAARPTLPRVSNVSSPHEQTTAQSGSHKTGVGSSNNIVVSSSEYSAIFSRLNQIDDDMGRALFRIASDIEELCRGDFVIPRTVQKCNIISGGLKNALGEYRSLTEDTMVRTRRFVNGIISIG